MTIILTSQILITILKYTPQESNLPTLIHYGAMLCPPLGVAYALNVLQYDRSYRSFNPPLLATAPQFPVNPHLWSGKDPHRPDLLGSVILGEGLCGLDLPHLRLLNLWLGV